MFWNFTDDYKKILINAENVVKNNWYSQILTEDVFLEIIKNQVSIVYEIFMDYWINEKVVLDVLSQTEFNLWFENRKWKFIWISESLKNTIVWSFKIAASFNKNKAWVEDFILSLIINNTEWFINFLNFVWINPKDLEQSISNINKNLQSNKYWWLFEPINNILNILEQWFLAWQDFEDMQNNPFFANKKPWDQKEETQTPALDFFGIDLTEEAKNWKIDKIIWRDKEIERLISIINRKTKNNPCLVWEPWVGKTAVAEWLALRISKWEVPLAMKNKKIISLDLWLMVAGTKYRWEFESRIKQIIEEASKLENEIILFIDEIHTIIWAWSWEGTLDAANILKPAMWRWKICIIWATTLNEYQKYIEKDSALERRFQKIEVEEPSKEIAKEIITWLKEWFEEYHNLIIEEEAILWAIDYSIRYLTDKYLPDKAIDLIDEACSRKSMKYNYIENNIKEYKLELEKIQKEIDNFVISQKYEKAIQAKEKQKEIENKIKETRWRIKIPYEKRLHITKEDIQQIINQITWIPIQNLNIEDLEKLKKIEWNIKKFIIWQDNAIKSIVDSIKRSRTWIADKNRPIWSFLFLWPTWVGKTELVKILASEFFWDKKALIKIDMSEYSEKASVSKLLWSAPWYIWYEEWWMLTEKVRRKPYCIVLFDELEKWNFEIFNILLQILEEWSLTDSKWRNINFKNTIIIMTSNIWWEEFSSKAWQIWFNISWSNEANIIKDYWKIKDKVIKNLEEIFPPEFLNRIDKTIVFDPLNKNVIKKIIELQLAQLNERLKDINKTIKYDSKVINYILSKTYNPEYWARPIRRFIQDVIETELSNLLINKKTNDIISLYINKWELEFN